MTTPTSTPPQESTQRETSNDDGRRIRWERDSEDSERIVVLDAVTGKVIAVVRSLFEMCLR